MSFALPFEVVLKGAAILCAGFTLAVLGLVFLAGPESIRDRDGKIRQASRGVALLRILLVSVFFLGPLVFLDFELVRRAGVRPEWITLWGASYVAFMIFNLYDLVVLDYLLLRHVLPRWVDFPRTEYFTTFRPHLVSFFKGCIAGVPICAIAATLAWVML